jgi:hypothetical protein
MSDEKLTPAQKHRAAIEAKQAELAGALPVEPLADEVEAEAATEDEAELPPSPADLRRERLLQGLPPDVAAQFTDAELAELEAEAQQEAEADAKEKAKEALRKNLRLRARADVGLVTAKSLATAADKKRLAERVDFRFFLPEEGNPTGSFRVDGHHFHTDIWHKDYPRAVMESLRANFYQVHLNEIRFSTNNQDKPGRSARELMAKNPPLFEVRDAG